MGDDAYENADPAIFLKRQALMTKELAETFRRTEHEVAAGVADRVSALVATIDL